MSEFKSRTFACAHYAGQRIHELGLTKPNGDDLSIIILKLPKERLPDESELPAENLIAGTTDFPMVQLSRTSAPMDFYSTSGTQHRVAVRYNVLVSIMAIDNRDLTGNDDTYSWWWEQIALAFSGDICLPGVPQIWKSLVQPNLPIDPTAFFEKGMFHSGMILEFYERRQTNAVADDPIAISAKGQ
jgi:hypothetical protein